MDAYRSPQCSGNVELRCAYIVRNHVVVTGTMKPTCIITSRSVSGAGLTRVMSCAAADVINDPADWMTGCMRGASVSRVNVESEDGYV